MIIWWTVHFGFDKTYQRLLSMKPSGTNTAEVARILSLSETGQL